MTQIPKEHNPNIKMVHHLNPGQEFMHDGQRYKKIEDERLSCCKVNNCLRVSDNVKTMIVPATNVEIV